MAYSQSIIVELMEKFTVLRLLLLILCLIARGFVSNGAAHTTKKWGYPSIFKTAGIGSKFLSRRFFSRRFKPLAFECGDRVTQTCTSAFQKRWDRSRRFQILFQSFYLCWDSLYENVNITYTSVFTTCASAFESTGIGCTYASASKSVGIGHE